MTTTKQVDVSAADTLLSDLITSIEALRQKVAAAADDDYAKFVLTQSDTSREVVRRARAALDVLPKFANGPVKRTRMRKTGGTTETEV